MIWTKGEVGSDVEEVKGGAPGCCNSLLPPPTPTHTLTGQFGLRASNHIKQSYINLFWGEALLQIPQPSSWYSFDVGCVIFFFSLSFFFFYEALPSNKNVAAALKKRQILTFMAPADCSQPTSLLMTVRPARLRASADTQATNPLSCILI